MSTIEHIRRWKDLSNIDYYLLFVRTWIPFNAWYAHAIGKDKSDNDAISNLCKNSNVKEQIISLLNENEKHHDSLFFKKELALLHLELKRNYFPNNDNRISFAELNIRQENTNNTVNELKGRYHYKLIRYTKDNPEGKPNKSIHVELLNKALETKMLLSQERFNIDELKQSPEYCRLSNTAQRDLLNFYISINPQKVINLEKYEKNNKLMLDKDVFFIKDYSLISIALLWVLYELRCKIFHGELMPTEDNKKIYKHATNLLSIILNKII